MKAPLLTESVARDRRLWLNIFGIVSALALVACVASVMKVIARGNVIYGGALLLLFGIGFVLTLVRKTNPGLEALKNAPATVVWVYPVIINGDGAGRVSILISTVDGKQHGIVLPQSVKESQVMAEVVECAPHAAIGYRSDWKDLFFASPGTFLQKVAVTST